MLYYTIHILPQDGGNRSVLEETKYHGAGERPGKHNVRAATEDGRPDAHLLTKSTRTNTTSGAE